MSECRRVAGYFGEHDLAGCTTVLSAIRTFATVREREPLRCVVLDWHNAVSHYDLLLQAVAAEVSRQERAARRNCKRATTQGKDR